MDSIQIRKKNSKYNNITQPSRESEKKIRAALQSSSQAIELAHVDRQQRYTFIYNTHPDFCAEDSLGKTDDEINLNEGTIKLRKLKKNVIESGMGAQEIISFPVPDGTRTYHISVEPLRDNYGHIKGATSVSVDITGLTMAVPEDKKLSGILPLCSYCKSIRNGQGGWENVDEYITKHTESKVSHGICPECMQVHHPDVYTKLP